MAGLESIDGGGPWFRCPQPMVLGEAPIYRASDSTLHWNDCLAEPCLLFILKVDPDTGDAIGEARTLQVADSVTVTFFRKNKPGSYIGAYYQGVCFIDEQTGKLEVVKEIIPTDQRDELRFNDGNIDAKGRFWLVEIDKKVHSLGSNKIPAGYSPRGRLWRYDPDGSLHLMIDKGIACGNGLAFSPDNKTLYLHDSTAMVVYAYDFDLETGNISNRRLLVDRRNSFGAPDGLVVDTNGNLWIAMYESNRIMVFSPEGRHLKDIVFSALNPTCTTWGGKNHDIIYLTTGSDRRPAPNPDDEGGHMFRFKPSDARGQPKNEFAG